MMLTYIFGLVLKWFQPGNFISPKEDFWAGIRYLIFPAVAVALPKIAMVVKFLRNAILGEIGKDYVRTAYSKGNMEGRVLYMHVLKNALIPVLTFIARSLPRFWPAVLLWNRSLVCQVWAVF